MKKRLRIKQQGIPFCDANGLIVFSGAHECLQRVKSHLHDTASSIVSGSAALQQRSSKKESPDLPVLAVEYASLGISLRTRYKA
jgi:hypothetical protein